MTRIIYGVWLFIDDNFNTYQCSRLTSLFKEVYNDGDIKYFDVNGYEMYNLDPTLPKNDGACYNGFVNSVMDDLYPLEMPYVAPLKKPAVYFAGGFMSENEFDKVMVMGIISVVSRKDKAVKEKLISFINSMMTLRQHL